MRPINRSHATYSSNTSQGLPNAKHKHTYKVQTNKKSSQPHQWFRCLSVSASVCQFLAVSVSVASVCQCLVYAQKMCLPVCAFFCLFVFTSVSMSLCLSVSLSLCFSVVLCLSVSQSLKWCEPSDPALRTLVSIGRRRRELILSTTPPDLKKSRFSVFTMKVLNRTLAYNGSARRQDGRRATKKAPYHASLNPKSRWCGDVLQMQHGLRHVLSMRKDFL